MSALSLKQLTKRYGARRGIEAIDLEVPEGVLYGLIGPNGAGKSTTLRTLLGLLRPTTGSALLLGLDATHQGARARAQVGAAAGSGRALVRAERRACMSDESARERILSAALEEFASRGYEAASTNAIAAKAGVAKGLVFHHFESKEVLCETLFDREARRLTELVFDAVGTESRDLFERLFAVFQKKVELSAQHPLTAEFLIVAVTEAPPTLRGRLALKQAALMKEAWPRLLEGLDASRLKPGLALGDAVETLSLLGEGLERQLSALLKARRLPPAEIGARMWRHFERLRDGLYRS